MDGVEFQKIEEEYHVYIDGEFIYKADKIAIAVDFDPKYEMCVAHIHGSEDNVSKWVIEARDKLKASGFHNFADRLIVIVSDDWGLEELNRIWNCTGSINSFLKRNGITGEGQGHRGGASLQSQDVPEA